VVGGSVTVLIPSIPPRTRMLNRALVSVLNQMRMPDVITVSIDHDRDGSAANRNRELAKIDTEWVAFLDDDDEFLPSHLLVMLQNSDNADVIYTGCTVIGPHGEEIPDREEWGRFGRIFDPVRFRKKSYLPVTSLVRMELARECSFIRPPGSVYDDWGFYLKLLDKDARFLHVPQRTWIWHHHGTNTQGLPTRW
jgi:hypothetical protein